MHSYLKGEGERVCSVFPKTVSKGKGFDKAKIRWAQSNTWIRSLNAIPLCYADFRKGFVTKSNGIVGGNKKELQSCSSGSQNKPVGIYLQNKKTW